MDRKDRIGMKAEQQRLFEALRCIRKSIQWKSGKDVVHLKKRQRMNHIPLSATLLDYETIIIDLVNDPFSILYLYEFGEATFYGIRGFVKEREWLVIFGEGGIMETAFPPEDMDDYLGKRGFTLIGTIKDVLEWTLNPKS